MARPHQMMLKADYDRAVDVLYIILGEPVAVEGDGLPGGVELDFALDSGAPVGVTVIGFLRNHWSEAASELAEIVSKHLSVDRGRAAATIKEATADG